MNASLFLATTATTVTLGYIAACVIWPFKPCPRCTGSGRRRSPSGHAWRHCRRCKGTGTRLRTGRRLYNTIRRTYHTSHD